VVFCGSVFSEVLVWSLELATNQQTADHVAPVTHRLTGHEGVIFRNAEIDHITRVSEVD
jgi:hypothetical protein